MSDTEQSIKRYTSGNLRERLYAALRSTGKEPAVLLPGDLEDADQFHSGGAEATAEVARAAGIGLGTRVLDVGAGIGGPARRFAQLGAVVTGVDVTEEFVLLARELNAASSMAGSITMLLAPAQATKLPAGSFDVATMMHVGMNVENKAAVFAEVHRLLRPGGVFAIYDLMGSNDLQYPVPWADAASASYVESAEAYHRHLRAAGFTPGADEDRTAAVLAFMGAAREAASPLGAPILLGPDQVERLEHVGAALKSGAVAPHLLVSVRAGA